MSDQTGGADLRRSPQHDRHTALEAEVVHAPRGEVAADAPFSAARRGRIITADSRLASAPGPTCRIVVVA